MKNKILIVLLVLMLIAYPMTVYAEDFSESTYATAGINYFITTLTTFTYTKVATVESMNFAGNRNEKNVYPEGTDDGANPWATITNNGEVNQNFIARLDSNNPPGFELLISNNQDMTENIAVTTAPNSPPQWTNVPYTAPGNTINLYAMANFNGAPDGTVSRTLKVGLPPVVESISVAPETAEVVEYTTQQFTTTITDQYDMAFIVPVTWTNENIDVGTIDSTGLYKGITPGRVDTITATAGGKSVNATVTVVADSSGSSD